MNVATRLALRALVAVLAATAAVVPAHGWEVAPGLALRQSAAAYRTPALEPLVEPAAFGLYEVRARPFVRVTTRAVALDFALESEAGFASSPGNASGPLSGSAGATSLFERAQRLQATDVLHWQHVNERGLDASSRIDRAKVTVRAGPLDIDVGRQAIHLGTSHFVGVLDVVAPFAPGALDATYKPGVDAVRLRGYPTPTAELELVAVAADPVTDGALFVRGRAPVAGIDLELVAGRFRRRNFGGLGWEGEVGPVGLWGEVGLFDRDPAEDRWRGGWSKAAFVGAAGVEMLLGGEVHAGIGGLFNDFGARNSAQLIGVYNEGPYREGWMFLGAAAYGVVTAGWQAAPLLRLSGAGLVNLIDGSTLWQPRVDVSVGDNTELAAFAWIGTGPGPKLAGLTPILASEFGTVPDGGGLYTRIFF